MKSRYDCANNKKSEETINKLFEDIKNFNEYDAIQFTVRQDIEMALNEFILKRNTSTLRKAISEKVFNIVFIYEKYFRNKYSQYRHMWE